MDNVTQRELGKIYRELAQLRERINRSYSGAIGNAVTEKAILDRIIRMGVTWTTYDKTAAGLTTALAAAIAGETVFIPPGVYSTDVAIPDEVTVIGLGYNNSVINGQVQFAGNGRLTDCAIVINANDENNYTGVLAPDVPDATGHLNRVFIYVNNAGAGNGYGIVAWGRAGNIEGDYCPLIYGSTQDVLS